jgi:hypothetical protein
MTAKEEAWSIEKAARHGEINALLSKKFFFVIGRGH